MTHSLGSLPPLEGLHAVLVAAQGGSFTVAAETLGITHGAVSRRVAAVEAWLGTGIFDRHGRGVRLTPAGQRFTRQIEQALESIEQTSERWRPGRGRITVRLNVVPSFARLWLLPRMSELLQALPRIRIDLAVDHRAVDLDAGEADIVVRYGRGKWPRLTVRELFGETLMPAASPELAAQLGPDPGAADLAGFPLLHDSGTDQWRAWFAAAGLRYQPGADDRRFEDYDLVLAAAEGSLGLALLRQPLAKGWLDSGRLVPVSSQVQPNPQRHYLAHRQGEQRESVLAVADALCRMAEAPALP